MEGQIVSLYRTNKFLRLALNKVDNDQDDILEHTDGRKLMLSDIIHHMLVAFDHI